MSGWRVGWLVVGVAFLLSLVWVVWAPSVLSARVGLTAGLVLAGVSAAARAVAGSVPAVRSPHGRAGAVGGSGAGGGSR